MAMPGWRLAMSSHLNLAMRSGRPRPENLFSDDELRSIEVPVRFILGDDDVYGRPEIGRRAAALMPDATVTCCRPVTRRSPTSPRPARR